MADDVYFGLMSGTSMDGVDAIAVRFDSVGHPTVLAEAQREFPPALRQALFALQAPGADEIDRSACAAIDLVEVYAACCQDLLQRTGLAPAAVRALGVHGQTVRHRPERGYTWQTNNPALLAERTGIDVIADFRSRDIAAGGQGAPLASAFHASMFGAASIMRVVCNIGGISNLTVLRGTADVDNAIGFDCGPGNALLDYWSHRQLGVEYDDRGQYAASGSTDNALLEQLLDEPFFRLAPPKSTGRDLFNPDWLYARLDAAGARAPADVQATLTALTAIAIVRDIAAYAPACDAVYVCGGGARNDWLMTEIRRQLDRAGLAAARLASTAALGIPPQQVEAIAFAWLARQFVLRQPASLPSVTGAAGARVLGALYPA